MSAIKMVPIAVVVTGVLALGVVWAAEGPREKGGAVLPAAASAAHATALPNLSVKDVSSDPIIWALSQPSLWRLTGDIIPSVAQAYENKDKDLQDYVWGRTPRGDAALAISLHFDAPCEGPVVLAFFTGNSWLPNPVQLRKTDGQKTYRAEHLPAGAYWIAALHGDPKKPDLLGVHATWPKPVVVGKGATPLAVPILLSAGLAKDVTYYSSCSRSREPKKAEYDPKSVVLGYVTDPVGDPVPQADIRIREVREPGQDSFHLLEAATDQAGYYFCGGVNWPYKVSARRYVLRPDIFGYCFQCVGRPEVHERPEQINFVFGNPAGTGEVLRGKVLADDGAPVTQYMLSAFVDTNGEDKDQPLSQTGWTRAVFSEDGSFCLPGAPSGKYRLAAQYYGEFEETVNLYEHHGRDSAPAKLVMNRLYPRYVKVVRYGLPARGAYLNLMLGNEFRGISEPGRSDENGLLKVMLTRETIRKLAGGNRIRISAHAQGTNLMDTVEIAGTVLKEHPEDAETVAIPVATEK